MKRGGVVRLACKAHVAGLSMGSQGAHSLRDLVVVGSNPTPASIILAVYWHKNRRVNVEKTSCFLKPFLKISSNLPRLAPPVIKSIYHRLAAFIVHARRCILLHGVDILS